MTDTVIRLGLDTGSCSVGALDVRPELEELARASGAAVCATGGYGLYHLEPLVEIVQAGTRHAFANVAPEDVAQLIQNGVVNNAHPRYVGLMDALPELACQKRITFRRAGLIAPADVSAYRAHGGLEGLKKALQMPPQQVIDIVKESGLRGRGGAGFPTGVKWQTVLDAAGGEKYVVCNADEGDSGTFADRLLMESDPMTLLEGMVICGWATGASKGYIYLRSEYPLAAQRLRDALKAARLARFLGEGVLSSGFDFDIDLRIGAGAYICGEETSLLESLEGKRGTIRYKPPLPALQGAFGKPTALNNVITLASVPEILRAGAEHYARCGVDRSRGTLTVQLAGNIKNGGLYELPFGVTLDTLLHEIGGGSFSGRPIKAVQVGGPLGSYFPPDLFSVPLTYEDFAAHEGMLGHGGVVVFDDQADLALQAQFAFEFCAHESCGKCTPCRIGSTRGAELVKQIRAGKNGHENVTLLTDLCELMEQTSLCALGGLTPYPVRSAFTHFPRDFGL